jgi:hypothetical protein
MVAGSKAKEKAKPNKKNKDDAPVKKNKNKLFFF